MIDNAKEVLGNVGSINMLREENAAVFKESQRISKELEETKRDLAKAREELSSLAIKNASALQDLKDQLSQRQDESTVVDEKLLGRLREQTTYLTIVSSRKCFFLTLCIFGCCSSCRLWR